MLTGSITPRSHLEGVWHHPAVIVHEGDSLRQSVTLSGHYHTDAPIMAAIDCVEMAELTFDGTQYVMTDYRPNQRTRIEVLFRAQHDTLPRYLFGCRTAAVEEENSFWLWMKQSGAAASCGTETAAANTLTPNTDYVLTQDKSGVLAQEWRWMTLSETGSFSGDTLCIGGLHHARSVDEGLFKGSIRVVRIYEGQTLVRSYIPACRGETEGLFDLVTGQLVPRQTAVSVSRFGEAPMTFSTTGTQLMDYILFGTANGVGDYDAAVGKYRGPLTVASKNLLDNNYQSETYGGLTITVNPDKSITVNGTATRSGAIVLFDSGFYTGGLPASVYQEIANGSYILSGSPEGSAVGSYILSYRYTPAIGEVTSQADRVSVDGVTLNNTTGTYKYLAVYIAVWQGATLDNVTFRPMLRRTDTTDEYEPYFYSRTELLRDAPLGAGEQLSFADTQQAVATTALCANTLTVDTQVQPAAVYIAYAT